MQAKRLFGTISKTGFNDALSSPLVQTLISTSVFTVFTVMDGVYLRHGDIYSFQRFGRLSVAHDRANSIAKDLLNAYFNN